MRVSVLGAGGWGTALALLLSANNHSVTLWARSYDTIAHMRRTRINSAYLPGVSIPDTIILTHDPEEATLADMLVVAIPTQFIRPVFEEYRFRTEGKIIVSTSKGVERSTLMRVSEILHNVAHVPPHAFAALTGPSHAEEVARELPTTVVAASKSEEVAKLVQRVFTRPTFRVYHSADVIGAELGGAVKNVIAISAGIVDGLGMGDNTKAALITRGLAEITRLGVALGAQPMTFSGLSGLGDLIVTCASRHSRNRAVGEHIARGKTLDQIRRETQQIAEGVFSSESIHALAQKTGVEMPIVHQVYEVLFHNKTPYQAIQDLMTREMKPEYW
ncbi:MAG: NAD(P)H-dependent glycerol-3-phosphate dehydrogenase [Bacteroidota bacterium]|nr:NAD(P)-dependent glycerol-3-phosphate dehydrogenase [Candidatus Kapabacteria bacterium]MDW8220887.1 NAD(P)H-dependent glycerol-3-phosphate dehydrogenase [Bacteroidota bacterium]